MTAWIQTYTGVKFDLLEPTSDMVDIRDIAHALARICRFTGHVPDFYSVAQHSVLLAEQVPEGLKLQGLLHDAQEAYVGDMSSPLKRAMRHLTQQYPFDPSIETRGMPCPYEFIELRVWLAVAKKFDLPEELDVEVKKADLRMLLTEKRMFGKEPQRWNIDAEPYGFDIKPWTVAQAEANFIRAFDDLMATCKTPSCDNRPRMLGYCSDCVDPLS